MLKVLITGFEPFGKYPKNSSWATAQQVVAQGVMGVEFFLRIMPVSFQRVAVELRAAVDEVQPNLILMLGQAAVSDKIRLERIAINMMDSVKGDNDGCVPDEEPIYPSESTALFTNVPIKKLCSAIAEQGLPVVVSNSCGLYVCNRLYYEALRLCQSSPNMKALFVHMPLYKGQTGVAENVGMELSEMVKVLSLLITHYSGF
ncbi:MAG: pyroglutamyl-peptidase I [Bacteroidaceae bacterium]|nr:pyroglutamyl-peptidase I [Bacteroidaceae bacterium]